jgi:hypothetical protein
MPNDGGLNSFRLLKLGLFMVRKNKIDASKNTFKKSYMMHQLFVHAEYDIYTCQPKYQLHLDQ